MGFILHVADGRSKTEETSRGEKEGRAAEATEGEEEARSCPQRRAQAGREAAGKLCVKQWLFGNLCLLSLTPVAQQQSGRNTLTLCVFMRLGFVPKAKVKMSAAGRARQLRAEAALKRMREQNPEAVRFSSSIFTFASNTHTHTHTHTFVRTLTRTHTHTHSCALSHAHMQVPENCCSYCLKDLSNVGNEFFSRLDFKYCSMHCLQTHRLALESRK